MNPPDTTVKRIAIIGGGSSGLISLKYAQDRFPNAEVCCFEKSSATVGCWGRPAKGFVSTSTKFTTQFACFQKFDARVRRTKANQYPEFFCDNEYGDYLLEFVEQFQLDPHVRLNTAVRSIEATKDDRWKLEIVDSGSGALATEEFTHVIVCTGLVDQANSIEACQLPTIRNAAEASSVNNKRVVVVGGGESAVDIAERLANPVLGNEVYLSLRSGVRVSPRYHPIRGVPSDFLRNRMLLANHYDVRNAIGQKFVEARILFTRYFSWLFPSKQGLTEVDASSNVAKRFRQERRDWDIRLTKASKDRLFNVFHNKSDTFLDSVAAGRIQIIGENVDDSFREFYEFQSSGKRRVGADLVVPSIGYRNTLGDLFEDEVVLEEFLLGCLHQRSNNLAVVGFARPIIGNIPSISEMQARFVCGAFAGDWSDPESRQAENELDRGRLAKRFPVLDTNNIYPVEMFPYCDVLAGKMNCFPTRERAGSFRKWVRTLLQPATTLHYFEECLSEETGRLLDKDAVPIHTPILVTLLLVAAKPIDLFYRGFRRIVGRK